MAVNERERQWLLSEKHAGIQSPSFFADLERLQAGEPLAYLIGHVPFLGATIYLDSHPHIPRTETEYWVERAIEELTERRGALRVLDLCAGSGCIGVAVLKALPMARVDFVEMDTRHHATIEKNIRENNIDPNRTRILGGNLFEQITDDYDAILANPPYIDPALQQRVAPSVLAHEPRQALFGGEHGIELIEGILREAPRHLRADGLLFIEHEPEQADALRVAAAQFPATTTYPDQYGTLRYTLLSLQPSENMAQ